MCIKSFLKLFSNSPKLYEKPELELLQVSSEQVKAEIDLAKLKLLYPVLLDAGQPYYHIKAEDWAEALNWLYFKQGLPEYESGRMDCDDFAIWMKGLVAANFGLNYFGVVFGNSPPGYHAWNILRADNGLLQLEPQTGKLFELSERGYYPEYILL